MYRELTRNVPFRAKHGITSVGMSLNLGSVIFGCVTWGRLLKLSESHFPHLLNEVIVINAKDNASHKLSLDDAFFAP